MTDWNNIQASRENWERFCFQTGMKVIVLATQRVREQQQDIASATNDAIEDVAQSLEAGKAPAHLVERFRQDYLADRANQLHLVAESVATWPEAKAKADQPRKRRSPKGK